MATIPIMSVIRWRVVMEWLNTFGRDNQTFFGNAGCRLDLDHPAPPAPLDRSNERPCPPDIAFRDEPFDRRAVFWVESERPLNHYPNNQDGRTVFLFLVSALQ